MRLLEEAGLPAGVGNLVLGAGADAAAPMVEDPRVDLVSFTGGLVTGRRVMASAAATVKKVALELGGKNPNIVFADADLERFATESPLAVFDNAGQDCCARSRILVERSVHEKVVELFTEATGKLVVGDPADEKTQVGSLVSLRQRERVQDYIEAGQAEGARLALGGGPPDDPQFAGGAFLMPTVFDACRADMRIMREEIFGPVVGIIPFDTEEEAIRLANATPYGLAASVWTRDLARGQRMIERLETGMLGLNAGVISNAAAPFGGVKQSGLGREGGVEGIHEYLTTKYTMTPDPTR